MAGKGGGGAWKVAYADFVTAMMAFFMLLWLVGSTTPEQKAGVSDYFPESDRDRRRHGRLATRRSISAAA